MECRDQMGQRVLPIFYHVDPSDLRGQKGKFTTAFQQNEEKFRGEMEKLNKWRESLVTASKISGWHVSKAVNVRESEIINKIVQVILEGMHDLIQEMGWKIVRQSFSNSRLWEPEEIHDVLESNRGPKILPNMKDVLL
ncbi:hypothetical protein L6452_08526 [Arctium lappa]|uniref:Uncharacterized protein n=1 Tax=Arctium lappa TaxID=4217 RepID=A0ACB9DHY2_ARCLA|nr:hypothetical protein L6452_08526 [Arctium lappa]